MQFLAVLVLAGSASALRRRAAAASDDVAAFFTGFSDGACGAVNTAEEEVTFSQYDGNCREIAPARSLTAVDAKPHGDVNWNFWAYTTNNCDRAHAVEIGNGECHAAAAGQPFLSFLMTTAPA